LIPFSYPKQMSLILWSNLKWQGVQCAALAHQVTQKKWFSSDTMDSSTNKTDCHNIAEILNVKYINKVTVNLILNVKLKKVISSCTVKNCCLQVHNNHILYAYVLGHEGVLHTQMRW
jgi:hypothetical protein